MRIPKFINQLSFGFLFILVACSPASAPQDNSSLADFSPKWRAAYEAGDFESMRDLYEPDAWLMTRHQPARKGVDEILAYFKTSREAGGKAEIVFEFEDESIEGDVAVKVAKWWLESPQAAGEPARDSGRSVVVFKRGDDRIWRLWRDIDNHTPDVNFEMKPNDQ